MIGDRGARRARKERRIAKALVRREPGAFERLYAAHGSTVRGYLQNTLRDHATAEDVHQQVFMEAWRRADSFDPERGSPFSWLMTIARSRAIDQLRRRVPQPRDPAAVAETLDDAGGASGTLDAVIERWRVADLLSELPADELTVLRLRFYEGLNHAEIAERESIPLGTVKSRTSRALRRMRRMIEAEEAGDG